MAKRAIVLITTLFCMLLSGIVCAPNSGSVTETGNVTGSVENRSSIKIAGAKISLFIKKNEITTPEETSKPVEETYTNDTGYFAFSVDKGNYTIVASSDSEFAFRDNIIPGSNSAQNMRVVLEPPGALKGEILNSLELRGTGSVVVHLIGTAIFQNVDSDGKFLIDNVPAGYYTLVSYSTYQPEFSPNYKPVTVYPDSVTDLGQYSLVYNGIPIPKNIKLTYDTVHQVVRISWDSVRNYKDFQEYAVLRGDAGGVTHNLQQIGYTQDTVFFDTIKFTSVQLKKYEYCVLIHDKLGDAGKYYGIYAVDVLPYSATLPIVSAGPDQVVDINSDVVLQGSFSPTKWPIKKVEWKIENDDWVEAANGKITFRTSATYDTETIVCVLRATDSAGNISADTAIVSKQQMVVDFGDLPFNAPSQGSATMRISATQTMTVFKNELWSIGEIDYGKWAVWSTKDLTTWKTENESPGIQNNGQLLSAGGTLYYLNIDNDKYSYKSSDGVSWTEITPVLPKNSWTSVWYTNFSSDGTNLFVVGQPYDSVYPNVKKDSIFTSSDGVTWNRSEIAIAMTGMLTGINKKLYLISDNGQRLASTDNGLTWVDDPMWDPNYATFPDDCFQIVGNDSVTVAYYNKRPENITKLSVLRNGVWSDVSQSNFIQSTNEYQPLFLFQNRLFHVHGNYMVNSIKLY